MISAFSRVACSRSLVQGRGGLLRPPSLRLLQIKAAKGIMQPPHMSAMATADINNHNSLHNNKFFITTPIYYVNGEPHLGHAYTSVVADVIARYNRHIGKDVYFLSGTDEHGQKVEQSALLAKQTPLSFADNTSAKFRNLMQRLQCSNDDFIRTTESRHKDAVQALWDRLEANGQIYLGAYEGWYSIRDEAFYAENELVNGKAPTGAEVQWVKEESYFFRLSEWTEKLLKFYEDHPDFICPKGRKNEVVSFVSQEGGLKDLSISRTTFSWGIPVPKNPKHVVYVWLDALTNYISALGYPNLQDEKFLKYWPAAVHVVGKDILRFHAVFWPAFVMAAGLEPPKRVFAHGWWTKDGEKMSKSLGNVIEPNELLDKYGVDYVRYFLTSEIHFGNDGDFSHDLFAAKINAELANDLGNLVQRVTTFVQKQCDGKIPTPKVLTEDDKALLNEAKKTAAEIQVQLESQNLKSICDLIIGLAKSGNKYIDVNAPWVLVKTDPERMKTVLYVLMELLRVTAIYLHPVIPVSCDKLFDQLGVPQDLRSFGSISSMLPSGIPIGTPSPIFPKIEVAEKKDKIPVSSKAPKVKANKDDISADTLQKLAVKYPKVMTTDDLSSSIQSIGDHIRQLKIEKVSKSSLEPFVQELKYLKDR